MTDPITPIAVAALAKGADKGTTKLIDLLFSSSVLKQKRLETLSSAQDTKDAELIQAGLAEFRDGKFILIEDQIGNPTSPLGLILSQNRQNQSENLGSCINKAYEYLSEKENEEISNEEVSKTFFNKWMNYGKEISEEELQDLWGSILAKEIAEPNSINSLVLNALSMMSKKHLEAFNNLLPFICQTCLFCDPNKTFIENYPFADPIIIDELMDLNIIKSIYSNDIFEVNLDVESDTNNGLHSCLRINPKNLICFKTRNDQNIKPTFFGLSTIASKLQQIAINDINIEEYCSKLVNNLKNMPAFVDVISIALYQTNNSNQRILTKVWDIK